MNDTMKLLAFEEICRIMQDCEIACVTELGSEYKREQEKRHCYDEILEAIKPFLDLSEIKEML